ncbi:MAG: T9SS type A sorting domain-containing protein [Bacteroidota bacterium]
MRNKMAILASLVFIALAGILFAQEKDGKIVVEITKEINGEKKTFKGEYSSKEEMEADPNYQEFAGGDDQFHFWSNHENSDVFLYLDQMKDMKSHFFKFFDHEDEANSFFFHGFDADSASGAFNFHFDSFDSEELREKMKNLGIEMEALADKFSDDEDLQRKTITKKHIKIIDVDDEFGSKGKVNKNNLLELDDLTFHPNPSGDGRIRIRFTAPIEGELEIKVINLDRKQVFSRYFESFSGFYSESIDLSRQKEGIYLLEISQEEKRITKKIVIE